MYSSHYDFRDPSNHSKTTLTFDQLLRTECLSRYLKSIRSGFFAGRIPAQSNKRNQRKVLLFSLRQFTIKWKKFDEPSKTLWQYCMRTTIFFFLAKKYTEGNNISIYSLCIGFKRKVNRIIQRRCSSLWIQILTYNARNETFKHFCNSTSDSVIILHNST